MIVHIFVALTCALQNLESTPVMVSASVSIDTDMFVIVVSWQVCTYMSCVLYECCKTYIVIVLYYTGSTIYWLYSKHYHVQYHCDGSV